MSWNILFVLTVVIMFSLMLMGEWIAFSLGLTGLIGIVIVGGIEPLSTFGSIAWTAVNSFEYTAIPLFILMGEVMVHSGLSKYFYAGGAKWFGRLPGGLLQTNIICCSVFAAISGSSPATASAIGAVSFKEMVDQKYNKSMILGSLAGGGALGILIPPSITMIIYGSIAEVSIEKLFMAGLFPGILAALIFMVYIGAACTLKKGYAPEKTAAVSFREKLKALIGMAPFFIMVFAVLGGIYSGFATTTEAAAVGALLAIIFSFIVKGITKENFIASVKATIRLSSMIMFIVVCAKILSYYIVLSGISHSVTSWMVGLHLPPVLFLVFVSIIYLILGCLMDGASMLYITIPLLLPTIKAFNFDLIWFGVILVILIEIGMLTPPVGLNLYVLHGVANNLGVKTTFGEVIKGALPYVLLYAFVIVLLCVFPQIAMFLPGTM